MRYYRIDITRQDGSSFQFKSLGSLPLTSLLPSGPQSPAQGITNPAALNIELDIAAYNYSDPDVNSWVRIWGLGLQDLGSASDLNGLNIAIYGGMAKGLPLANPQQAGLLVKGQVYQAFGNWIGTEQTVDMMLQPGGPSSGSSSSPQNFPFTMPVGTPMATAIKNTLGIALPNLSVVTNINANLVLNYDQTGHYQSLAQFADFIRALSQGIIGGDYPGVTIAVNGGTVNVFDNTPGTQPVRKIAFQDMIGQPTWVGPQTISVKLVMRSDIHVGDQINLPPSLVTTAAAALTRFQDRTTFTGNFQVQQVHHYGCFRQPSADAWNTTIQAFPVMTSGSTPQASTNGLLGRA